MTQQRAVLLNKEELIQKAIYILHQELGPIETYRFISMTTFQRMESVKRHHQWQEKLDKEVFFDEVFKKV
ncbi:MAG: hypothetical protein HY559_04055 [Gammaproteobacteria bacterium]|nr:hypothetical protein [Gammaproteobacteria bacterium]